MIDPLLIKILHATSVYAHYGTIATSIHMHDDHSFTGLSSMPAC